jgi:hypothetical protein
MASEVTVLTIIWLVMLTVGFVGWAIREGEIAKQLEKEGIAAEAVVIDCGDLWWTRNRSYYVIYQYEVQEPHRATYERRQAIGSGHYRELRNATHVSIRYLKSDPAISRLSGKDVDNISRDASLFRAVMGSVMLIIFLMIIR